MNQTIVPINGLQQHDGLSIVTHTGFPNYLQDDSYQSRYYVIQQPDRVLMLEVLWSVIRYQIGIHRNENVYNDFRGFNTNNRSWNNVRIDERIHTYFDDLMMSRIVLNYNRNQAHPITYDWQRTNVAMVQNLTNCNRRVVVYCSPLLQGLVELNNPSIISQFGLRLMNWYSRICQYRQENPRQLSIEYNRNEYHIIQIWNGFMIEGLDQVRSLNLMAHYASRFTAFSTFTRHIHHQENSHQLPIEYHGNESSIPRYCDLEQIDYDPYLQGKLIMKTEIILVKEDNTFERVHSYYDKLCEHAIEKINDKDCSATVEENLCDEKTGIVDDEKNK